MCTQPGLAYLHPQGPDPHHQHGQGTQSEFHCIPRKPWLVLRSILHQVKRVQTETQSVVDWADECMFKAYIT